MNNQANTENKEAASSASSLVQKITALLAKITPGEWRTVSDEPYDLRVKAGSHEICGVWLDDAPVHDYNAEQRANAEAIAALPRLLRHAQAEIEGLRDNRDAWALLATQAQEAKAAAEAEIEGLQQRNRLEGKLHAAELENVTTQLEAAEARAEAAEARLKAAREHRAGCMECQHFRFCREIDPLLSDASSVRDAGEPCTFTGELTPERRCSRGSWGCVTKTHEGDAGEGEQAEGTRE